MKYFVYVLENNSRRHYIGCTSDLTKRILYHNAGKNRSTKPYRPWQVIYSEEFNDKHKAFQREWFLKHPIGFLEKKAIIEKHGGFA